WVAGSAAPPTARSPRSWPACRWTAPHRGSIGSIVDSSVTPSTRSSGQACGSEPPSPRRTACSPTCSWPEACSPEPTRYGSCHSRASPSPRDWWPDGPPLEQLAPRSEEHTSELQSRENLVCRLLLEKKNG